MTKSLPALFLLTAMALAGASFPGAEDPALQEAFDRLPAAEKHYQTGLKEFRAGRYGKRRPRSESAPRSCRGTPTRTTIWPTSPTSGGISRRPCPRWSGRSRTCPSCRTSTTSPSPGRAARSPRTSRCWTRAGRTPSTAGRSARSNP
ncbi:MAG: hypothetical protein M0C28_01405 [Candidatus Moduliflexus flocculans]|nr:hypothetical protein [Candidatus Moduliflexus flocculans]